VPKVRLEGIFLSRRPLAQRIAQDGEIIHTRTGMPKAHPGLKEELAARAFVCRNLERLGG
jgi:hypothetical protein